NLIVEIQQNSDTTYRVFDWNRTGADGKARALHVEESLRSIDFEDCQPALAQAKGELLVRHAMFEVQKWKLHGDREAAPKSKFAIVFCLAGKIHCANITVSSGEFLLVPASLKDSVLEPMESGTELLSISIPDL